MVVVNQHENVSPLAKQECDSAISVHLLSSGQSFLFLIVVFKFVNYQRNVNAIDGGN